MYGAEQKAVVSTAEVPCVPTPELNYQMKRFLEVNDRRTSMINQIEDKCHQIMNLRNPEAVDKFPPPPSINDFMTGFSSALNVCDIHNARLLSILEHLNKIV